MSVNVCILTSSARRLRRGVSESNMQLYTWHKICYPCHSNVGTNRASVAFFFVGKTHTFFRQKKYHEKD